MSLGAFPNNPQGQASCQDHRAPQGWAMPSVGQAGVSPPGGLEEQTPLGTTKGETGSGPCMGALQHGGVQVSPFDSFQLSMATGQPPKSSMISSSGFESRCSIMPEREVWSPIGTEGTWGQCMPRENIEV